MFRRAPVALRWTRISFERASRVRCERVSELAMMVLLSSADNERSDWCRVCPGHTVRREIRDTAYCITLNLDVRTRHLADKGSQPAELDDEKLVVD